MRFPLRDRLVLIPVELIYVIFPWLIVAALLRSLPIIAAILAGVVLFPLLLPWLPTHNFSTKGWILGAITALPFAAASAVPRAGAHLDQWRLGPCGAAGDAAGDGVPGAQLHWLNHLYLAHRRSAGNLPLYSADGLELWGRVDPYDWAVLP